MSRISKTLLGYVPKNLPPGLRGVRRLHHLTAKGLLVLV